MNDDPLLSSSSSRFSRAGDFLRTTFGPLLALACVVLLFALLDRWFAEGTFGTVRNFRTVAVQTCVVAVAALGMTLIIIAGGIDLSAGMAMALAATVLAWGLREDIAFRLWHGDNFVTASAKLEAAQKSLAGAEGAALAETLQARYAQRKEKLKAILDAKIEEARRRAEQPSAATDARLARRVADLEAKRARLDDPQGEFRTDRQWESGVDNSPWSAVVAVGMGVGAGIAAGLLNGLLISTLRVVPFIVTLGTMTIYLGLGNLLSGSVPIRPSTQHQVPAWLANILKNTPDAFYFGFPYGVWAALALAAALALVLRYHVFGRHVFAIGSNEATARLCGINVPATKVAVYALAGLFIGVAGIYHFSRLTVGDPTSGRGQELRIIAAVVIGGGSLSGGRGSVLGTLAGAAIMQVINSGCTQLGLGNPVQDIIVGGIIVGAVTLDQFREQRWSSGE